MKVAINRCYGGFSLSDEAFEMLLHLKGIEFETVPSKYSFGSKYEYYHKGHVRDDDHYISQYSFTRGYEPADRSDPDLIHVIEKLGEKANGSHSDLKIVEIPDGIKWHIHEYDGIEHVAEDHRTWC